MYKIYKTFIHNSLSSCAENILSNFISASGKSYSSNHVLLRYKENWKKSLDKKVLLELSSWIFQRGFGCSPFDLPIAKLHGNVLLEDRVTFVYSYLKCRKQGLKINNTESFFQILLSGVPQGSIVS